MSSKLLIFQVMTVVKNDPDCWSVGRHSSRHTGCQVCSQWNGPVGTEQAGVAMLRPKVKSRAKRAKNSAYHDTPLASASWVKAGSLSMKALCGMAAYSSRQNQQPPDRSRNRSAPAQTSSQAARL